MTLPTGTVTFLRTDVEGSMRLARSLGRSWDEVNATHHRYIRDAVEVHDGTIVRTEGDATFAVFPEAGAAVAAAVVAQRALSAEAWPEGAPIRVRMGLHSGEAHLSGDDYGGFDVNRAARVAAVGHGGQVVLSETTAALVGDALPDGTSLRDLGRHVLKDVPRAERLSQLEIAGLPNDFPPLRTAVARIGNLPDRLTSFVGRERELADLEEVAREARLITLTGPGGIGKTSLAIEVARLMESRFRDGAWLANLATLDGPDQVEAAIAHAIGLYDGPERSAASALTSFVGDLSMILILDNMEHLLAAADEVAAIVHASPTSRVIVTSRAPLRIAGEHEFAVAPLVDRGTDLFIDRARAIHVGWQPTDEAVITEICHLLDDLPLGIELAAARVSVLSPAIIRDRLAARLPLPGRGPRDAPARQRTLDGAVAWSHDLLPPDRQEMLPRVGVFEGGFDLEQVDAVVGSSPGGGDHLDALLELADQSLLVAAPAHTARARFRMLRTIQSFALDRLANDGIEAEVRRRHAEAYLTLATQVSHRLSTSRHSEWLDRMTPEQANLRSALRWSIDAGEGVLALRLTAALWRFWQAFGQVADGRQLAEEALAMPEAPTSGSDRAWALGAAGSLAYWQADTTTARRHYQAQIDTAEAAGDEACIADAYFNFGHVAFSAGDDAAAQLAHINAAEERYRKLGDERGAARASWGRGILAISWGQGIRGTDRGQMEAATAHLRESLESFERLDDRQYHAMTKASLAWAAFAAGNVGTASRLAVEALVESQAMRDLGTTTISLHIGVLLGALTGHLEEAAEVHGAFDALCERYGVRPPAALATFVGGNDPFEMTRQNLDPATWAAAYARGRRLTLDEAVAKVVGLADEASAL